MSKLVILIAILAVAALVLAVMKGGISSPDGEEAPGPEVHPGTEKMLP